jgi:CheY-like chemotaxis protein
MLHAQRMEAIGRLARGIAHDFYNMLMAILGHTELLLLRLGTNDPLRASIQTIQATAERAAALTRQLVTFSRRQVIAPKVLDLNEILTDMDKMLRRLIGEDVEIVYVLDQSLGACKIDPTQVEQVVMNLAVNARDAMPEGGRLTIRTANASLDARAAGMRVDAGPGDYVELVVADTGAGMDEATLGHIFEPFFTTKVQGKGTGLGLSTVYAIVQQNGGHADVRSEPGHGTAFTIRFPRVGEAAAAHAPAPLVDVPRGTETVLVCEDEDAVRDLVCEMLRMSGYTVIEARHGGEALLLCEQSREPIDLLLTDVVMPQMSGRQLAERLAPLQPDMKVLFMSGHTDDAVIRHGVKNAMMTFLQKPFTPVALARKVRAVLDAKS